MPIKPENKRRYPANWPDISKRIRFERAENRCECTGQCDSVHQGGRCNAPNGLYIDRDVDNPASLATSSLTRSPEAGRRSLRPRSKVDARLDARSMKRRMRRRFNGSSAGLRVRCSWGSEMDPKSYIWECIAGPHGNMKVILRDRANEAVAVGEMTSAYWGQSESAQEAIFWNLIAEVRASLVEFVRDRPVRVEVS